MFSLHKDGGLQKHAADLRMGSPLRNPKVAKLSAAKDCLDLAALGIQKAHRPKKPSIYHLLARAEEFGPDDMILWSNQEEQ